MKIAFFGTPNLAVNALCELETINFIPNLIITTPDAPVGRQQIITPPPTKVWAQEHNIPVIQPASLKKSDDLILLTNQAWDIFVVFAYGKIMPEWLINLPKYGTINAHPSLLPRLRGASPIRSTLLTDLSAAGVTIIQMDEQMDHGPILFQQAVTLTEPVLGKVLDRTMSLMCGDLLAHVLQELPKEKLIPLTQNHDEATFCTKITKEMAELDIDPLNLPNGEAALEAYRKICAFDEWPEAYFFYKGKRIKIKSAHLNEDGQLTISRIVPEGKKEMDFKAFFHK